MHNQYDLFDNFGIFPRSDEEEELVVRHLAREEHRKLQHYWEQPCEKYVKSM